MAIPAPRRVAHAPAARPFLPGTLLFFIALAGCQQQKQQSMVDVLPKPSYSGPDLRGQVMPPKPPPVALRPGPAKADKPAPFVAAPPVTPGTPRDWVPVAAPNSWSWIVIHHSATGVGGAARFDRMHREVNHWDELGYHFVVGNGTDTRDGQVEVGSRWPKQKQGAHAKTADNKFNDHGIGICLVGDFDKSRPTAGQMRGLATLVAHLQRTYRIPSSRIIGHGDTKATDCPGRNMKVAEVRRQSAQLLAEAGDVAVPTRAASAMRPSDELLVKAGTR